MTKKTIGSFLAALRRAQGMTQQELADKLNISNKSVSRWERDECAPDLILIPVIADIFGVTSDELLRGERNKPGHSGEPGHEDQQAQYDQLNTKKSIKQLRHILDSQLTRFHLMTLLPLGLILAGLVSLFVMGYGFFQVIPGFGLSVVFYAAGLISQTAFTMKALWVTQSPEFDGLPVQAFRFQVLRTTMGVVYLGMFALALSLPFVVFREPSLPRSVLNFSTWLATAPLFGGLAFLLCIGISMVFDRKMMQNDTIQHNASLKRKGLIGGLGILIVLFLVHVGVSNWLHPAPLARQLEFETFEDFREFAETPVAYRGPGIQVAVEQVHPSRSSEEFLERYRSADPNNPENTYYQFNETIAMIHWGAPIRVVTQDELARVRRALGHISVLFFVAYGFTVLATLLWYAKRRKKVTGDVVINDYKAFRT